MDYSVLMTAQAAKKYTDDNIKVNKIKIWNSIVTSIKEAIESGLYSITIEYDKEFPDDLMKKLKDLGYIICVRRNYVSLSVCSITISWC